MSRSRAHRDETRRRRTTVRTLLAPKLTQPLRAVWDHACWALANIWTLIINPDDLAAREFIARHEHRRLNDLVRHLELLARRFFLAAAMALNIIVTPLKPRAPKPRRPRRRVLVWPNRRETWRTRFRFLRTRSDPSRITYPRGEPSRVIDSFPLALRLESVRRVLARPDKHIRRLAIRLARLAARSANQPNTLGVRPWKRGLSRGASWIDAGMTLVMPILASKIDRWNEAADPG